MSSEIKNFADFYWLIFVIGVGFIVQVESYRGLENRKGWKFFKSQAGTFKEPTSGDTFDKIVDGNLRTDLSYTYA